MATVRRVRRGLFLAVCFLFSLLRSRPAAAAAVSAALLAAMVRPAAAQAKAPASARDPVVTRAQAAEMIGLLRQIRDLLARRGGGAPGVGGREVRLRLPPHAPALGRADAPVTVAAFTDLQCPFCRRFQARTFPRLEPEYIETGIIRLVNVDLPLRQHRYAIPAAHVAACAGAQGAYWSDRDAVLASPGAPTPAVLARTARRLDLRMPAWRPCLTAPGFGREVRNDRRAPPAAGPPGSSGKRRRRAAMQKLRTAATTWQRGKRTSVPGMPASAPTRIAPSDGPSPWPTGSGWARSTAVSRRPAWRRSPMRPVAGRHEPAAGPDPTAARHGRRRSLARLSPGGSSFR